MLPFLRTYGLVLLAATIGGSAFVLRPGGVEGPRPPPVPATGRGFEHEALDEVLRQGIKPDGRVDYAGLRAAPAALDAYLGRLRATSPTSAPHRFPTEADRVAYYLNAYNALALAAARDRCPLRSVHELYLWGGFFWRVGFLLGEAPITLSALESERLRAAAPLDLPVVFGLARATRGYPPLAREAYHPERLRAQFDAQVERTLRDPRFVRREGDVLRLSRFFEWYARDLGADPATFIRKRAPDLVPEKPEVVYEEVDLSLDGDC